MTNRTLPNPERTSPITYLVWLVPGLPLLWGVWQTLIKVAQLFQ